MSLQVMICADCGKGTTETRKTTVYIHHDIKSMGKHMGYIGGKVLCFECREKFEASLVEACEPAWEHYMGEVIL